jgi:ribonuclease PH
MRVGGFFSYFVLVLTVWANQDAEDRSLAMAIHQAIVPSIRLELLPKSAIDVFLTIVENDGVEGCIAAGSIAASTALANAGIEMLGLVMSCSAVIDNHYQSFYGLPSNVFRRH